MSSILNSEGILIMRLSRIVFAVMYLSFISGCATGPMPSASSGSSPVVEAFVAPPQVGLTRIFFYRNPLAGIGVQPEITLNGQSVGVSPLSGGYFYVDKAPGVYEVVLTKYLGSPKTTLTLEDGKNAYVRISISFMPFMGSSLAPEVVDSAIGAKEIQGLKRSGGPA